MAMTLCRECKAQISTTAESCPQCGAKPQKTSGCLLVLLCVIGFGIISSMVRGCVGDTSSSSETSTSSATPASTPASSAAGSESTTKSPSAEAAKQDPAAMFAASKSAVDEVEQSIRKSDEHLKKYYATPEQVSGATADLLKLAVVKGMYEDAKDKAQKALGVRADALIKRLAQQQRRLYASSLEQIFVKNGMDAQISASGKAKDQLRLKWVLMSRPLIYKLQNEMELQQQARTFGFKKIIYTDGYDESWSVDL